VYSTSVYLYTQRQHVVVLSGNSPRRYQLVYAKTLTINKGVDNKIQFQFLNQEQKPVNITAQTTFPNQITFRLISEDGQRTLLQKALTPTLVLNGLAELIVTSAEIEEIDVQFCSYSLETSAAGLDLPVFVDSEAGARGSIRVVNSVLPSFVPAVDVTIPSHPLPNSNTVTYTSSILYTNDSPLLSIQTWLSNYSGNVTVQGSVTQSQWYTIQNNTYLDATLSDGYMVEGFHPYVRLEFTSTQGNVTQILAR